MSDNVTGYGVPLTTAQRVAKYGARTRPTLTGKLPLFELDEALEPTYREAVLQDYESIDARARKTLSDRKSWAWFQAVDAIGLIGIWVLFAVSALAFAAALAWSVVLATVIILGFVYRKHETRKHTTLVEEALEHLQPFLESGKAQLI